MFSSFFELSNVIRKSVVGCEVISKIALLVHVIDIAILNILKKECFNVVDKLRHKLSSVCIVFMPVGGCLKKNQQGCNCTSFFRMWCSCGNSGLSLALSCSRIGYFELEEAASQPEDAMTPEKSRKQPFLKSVTVGYFAQKQKRKKVLKS